MDIPCSNSWVLQLANMASTGGARGRDDGGLFDSSSFVVLSLYVFVCLYGSWSAMARYGPMALKASQAESGKSERKTSRKGPKTTAAHGLA